MHAGPEPHRNFLKMQGDPPEQTAEDILKYALDHLESAMFSFCVFCDSFRKFCVEKGIIDNEHTT